MEQNMKQNIKQNMKKRLVIGMSGASGAPLTIELLKQLRQYREIIETHLIVTKGAQMTLEQETDYTLEQLYALADVVHDIIADTKFPFQILLQNRMASFQKQPAKPLF